MDEASLRLAQRSVGLVRGPAAKDQGARYLNVDQSVAHISDPDGYLIELSCEQ